jgi:hypothetical protein
MKNYLILSALVILFSTSSCRKPRKGDFEMVLSGETVTTTNSSSGQTVSIKQYASTSPISVKKTHKTTMEVGDMTWQKSKDKVSFVSTNVGLSTVFSSNPVTQTIVHTYDGVIKSNNSVEGTFVLSRTSVDSNSEEIEVTTGSFILRRK